MKSLLLAGGASMAFVASPAMAQDDGASEDDSTPIIVTGSRIVRQDYESNSPIVTVGEELLQNSSTSSLEVNLNKLPQFTPAQTPQLGADIQPTATNTPGAATVSPRANSSARTATRLLKVPCKPAPNLAEKLPSLRSPGETGFGKASNSSSLRW